MSSKTIQAAILTLVGASLISSVGCATIGPSLGFIAYPIPVSPFHMKEKEDAFHEHELYERAIILDPIVPGAPHAAIDPPSDDQIMRRLEKIDPVQGGFPLMHEIQRNNVQIIKEKIADFVDPPRVMPLVGPVQLHHARWKCTVHYTRVVRAGWPLPHTNIDETTEVVYIDQDHLHRVGGGPGNSPMPTP